MSVKARKPKKVVVTENRLSILKMLKKGVSISNISSSLGVRYDTVRDHVRIMTLAGLVSPHVVGTPRKVPADLRRLRPGVVIAVNA